MEKKYYWGHEVSQEGVKYGYVDYATLAKTFQHVLNNEVIEIGYWEPVCGSLEYFEDAEGNQYTPEEAWRLVDEGREDIDLDNTCCRDVFQWYIVSENGLDHLREANEIVLFNEKLNMYIWGVTHWGTSWEYVLTNIRL